MEIQDHPDYLIYDDGRVFSKKSNEFWSGRTSENNVVVFPKYEFSLGEIVNVQVNDCTTATLIGDIIKVKA